MTQQFQLQTPWQPQGDQPQAIKELTEGFQGHRKFQILHGVTGSGKTFTMAQIIARLNRPTLVLAPNKTLAAQLYNEFKNLFPKNAVEYFVSYYDYYQPEAYIPATDTYIEKDSSINDIIDQLRHAATKAVLTRRDVLVVASVSCIYGLGSPEEYLDLHLEIREGQKLPRKQLIDKLIEIQYKRNDMDFFRGTFRVRGDVIDLYPAYEDDIALRIELFGDDIDAIHELDPLRGVPLQRLPSAHIFPASHYVTRSEKRKAAIRTIVIELQERLAELEKLGKFVEAQRLKQRTHYDLELLQEIGFCNGIENYSRHLTGRKAGEPPPTLLDYFPKDFITFVDESHVTVPQIGGMYRGDRSRKTTLVEHGFRLPSALDNRPLRFDEFEKIINQVVFVSATPGPFELQQTGGEVTEQIIRPTGLIDPEIEVVPATHQLDHLLGEIRKTIARGDRILVTTLTKRMAEDITDYLTSLKVRVRYLHSDIATIERTEIIHDLRAGGFDVLVGINLLREGLDLPEVALVAILDADKEGFLRSQRSLIQTIGRAARNVNGKVIMYANHVTDSMRTAIDETNRRREIQKQFNKDHGLTPQTVQRAIHSPISADASAPAMGTSDYVMDEPTVALEDMESMVKQLAERMKAAAAALDFERAAEIRDKIRKLKEQTLGVAK
jgi:excinuclease ABC subunit B